MIVCVFCMQELIFISASLDKSIIVWSSQMLCVLDGLKVVTNSDYLPVSWLSQTTNIFIFKIAALLFEIHKTNVDFAKTSAINHFISKLGFFPPLLILIFVIDFLFLALNLAQIQSTNRQAGSHFVIQNGHNIIRLPFCGKIQSKQLKKFAIFAQTCVSAD